MRAITPCVRYSRSLALNAHAESRVQMRFELQLQRLRPLSTALKRTSVSLSAALLSVESTVRSLRALRRRSLSRHPQLPWRLLPLPLQLAAHGCRSKVAEMVTEQLFPHEFSQMRSRPSQTQRVKL